MINSLPIWSSDQELSWYRAVADNLLPAKYLIARRIPIPADFSTRGTDELWQLHRDTASQQAQLRKQIKQDPQIFSELSIQSPNLLDLIAELVNRILSTCTFCQWNCQVDRTKSEVDPNIQTGACQLGRETRIGSYFHHRGEELLYRGKMGSGTIFFTSCNMRCSFCQNGNISQDKLNGQETTADQLAAIMWILRMEGCHNINLVGGNPTIHLHTIIQAIAKLKLEAPPLDQLQWLRQFKSDAFIDYPLRTDFADYQGEFNVPILWNDNFFMSEEATRLLRTVIDIWLPDFKFGPTKKCATRLSRTPWYWDTIRRNLKQIYNWGEEFTIRHLVMPNHVECCTKPILDWVAQYLPGTQINIMDQYHPDSFTDPASPKYDDRYQDISRRLFQKEWTAALAHADQLGLDYQTISFS